MIRNTFYTSMILFFCIACNYYQDPNTEEKIGPKGPQLIEVNENALSSRGSTLGGGADEEPTFFMDEPTLSMGADQANRTIDSLKLVLGQDSSNIDVNFVLGANTVITCSFFYKENNAKSCWEGIPLLTRVIKQQPNYKKGAAYFNRGQAYLLAGQLDKAKADINKYIEIDAELPSAFAYYNLASIAYAQGDSTEACKCVQTARAGLEGFGSSSLAIWEKRCK